MKRSSLLFVVLLLSIIISGLGGCAAPDGAAQEVTLAPESALPDFVQDAPSQVKEAYRFAIASPDVLTYIPCYCGCGAMGHQSNRECYIKEVRSDGSLEIDNHAFG